MRICPCRRNSRIAMHGSIIPISATPPRRDCRGRRLRMGTSSSPCAFRRFLLSLLCRPRRDSCPCTITRIRVSRPRRLEVFPNQQQVWRNRLSRTAGSIVWAELIMRESRACPLWAVCTPSSTFRALVHLSCFGRLTGCCHEYTIAPAFPFVNVIRIPMEAADDRCHLPHLFEDFSDWTDQMMAAMSPSKTSPTDGSDDGLDVATIPICACTPVSR